MVDDAHASGVLGRNGRGSVDHFHVTDKVDVQVGTLSKAIGALGGYVCGSRDLIDYLYHRARPFLFSTSHPPSVAATCIAAFDILENEPDRIQRLWANTNYFKQQLTDAGFDVGGNTTPKSETPITPIIIGDGRRTMDFSRALFDAGVMATGIAFPTVPEGKARIRTIMTSEHTRAEIDQALEIFTTVAKNMGILQVADRLLSSYMLTRKCAYFHQTPAKQSLFSTECVLSVCPFVSTHQLRLTGLMLGAALCSSSVGAPFSLRANSSAQRPLTLRPLHKFLKRIGYPHSPTPVSELPDAPSALLYPQAGQTPTPQRLNRRPPHPRRQTTNPDAVSTNGTQQTKRVLGIVPNFSSVSADIKAPAPDAQNRSSSSPAKNSFDYSSFLVAGIQAGIRHEQQVLPRVPSGRSKATARYYWHTLADTADENFMVGGIGPSPLSPGQSLLHPRPRRLRQTVLVRRHPRPGHSQGQRK